MATSWPIWGLHAYSSASPGLEAWCPKARLPLLLKRTNQNLSDKRCNIPNCHTVLHVVISRVTLILNSCPILPIIVRLHWIHCQFLPTSRMLMSKRSDSSDLVVEPPNTRFFTSGAAISTCKPYTWFYPNWSIWHHTHYRIRKACEEVDYSSHATPLQASPSSTSIFIPNNWITSVQKYSFNETKPWCLKTGTHDSSTT